MNTTQSDELNWKLQGVRTEISQHEARITYLRQIEQSLVSNGMTGTPTAENGKGKAAPAKAKAKGRKPMSEDAKKRQSEALKRAWAKRKGETTTTETAPAGEAPYAPPVATAVPETTQA